MSSFICEFCGTEIIDSPHGYTTGCEHWPLEAEDMEEPMDLEQLLEHLLEHHFCGVVEEYHGGPITDHAPPSMPVIALPAPHSSPLVAGGAL